MTEHLHCWTIWNGTIPLSTIGDESRSPSREEAVAHATRRYGESGWTHVERRRVCDVLADVEQGQLSVTAIRSW